MTHGPSDRRSYLEQRAVFEHVCREPSPDPLFVDETMLGVLDRVSGLAAPRCGGIEVPAARDRREVVERAREVLARRFTAEPQVLRQVYWGALLHDIGKIGIADRILLKAGPLTPEEWQVMRTHPDIGHRILAAVPGMAQAAEIVLAHEERFDGSGYPRRLAGAAIPLWARLFAVIDTLDAMTSDRPYRKALSYDDAEAEISHLAGTQFDPQAVRAFMAEEATLRAMVAAKCIDTETAIAAVAPRAAPVTASPAR